jgi:NitT/TauT family transport system substrate-binding protein
MIRPTTLIAACLLAAAAALLPLAACSPPKPLTVATHPWVGYEPLYLARDLKWLPDDIRLREDQRLGASLESLRSGEMVVACMTLDEMLRARAAGIPLSAAWVFDVSAGADAVMVRPDIGRPADLAGRRIGFDHSAVGALVFEMLLDIAGLPASAVTQVDLSPAQQMEAWRRNEVDAVITYEPLASTFAAAGARRLIDTRQMPDTVIDVLAVRRDRPGVLPMVRELAAVHFRTIEYMRTHEQDALFRIAAHEQVTPNEARSMLVGVSLPSLPANRGYLNGPDARLVRIARTLSAVMVRRGLLPREDDLAQLTLPGILPSGEPAP